MSSLSKNLKLVGSVALSMGMFNFAKADSMEYGLCGNFGMTLMGGGSFVKNDKYDGPNKDGINKGLDSAKTELALPFGVGLFFGMNFGDDGAEMFGFEIDAKFAKLGYGVTAELSEDGAASSNNKDKKKEKISANISSMGVGVGVAGRFLFLNYDGGSMFVKLGADTHIGIMNNFDAIVGEKSLFADPDNATDAQKKEKGELKGAAVKSCKPFNVAPKLSIGATFADEIVSAGITGRLWLMDMFEASGKFKEFIEKPNSKFKGVSFGKMALDLSLSVGINFAPMFA